jgi:hypothetical protein
MSGDIQDPNTGGEDWKAGLDPALAELDKIDYMEAAGEDVMARQQDIDRVKTATVTIGAFRTEYRSVYQHKILSSDSDPEVELAPSGSEVTERIERLTTNRLLEFATPETKKALEALGWEIPETIAEDQSLIEIKTISTIIRTAEDGKKYVYRLETDLAKAKDNTQSLRVTHDISVDDFENTLPKPEGDKEETKRYLNDDEIAAFSLIIGKINSAVSKVYQEELAELEKGE